MEAWQISHYRQPQLVPLTAELSDDGRAVVLRADAEEYEIGFSGVDGRQVLDSVLLMTDPTAEIWTDISLGTALSWQTSLVQQLDSLSLVRGEAADPHAFETQISDLARVADQSVEKIWDAIRVNIAFYKPAVTEFLRLIDAPAGTVDQFSIDDVGVSPMRDNFAVQTFFLQKLYVEENLPIVLDVWRFVLRRILARCDDERPDNFACVNSRLTSIGFYSPAQVQTYLLCLIDLLLLVPKPDAARRFRANEIECEAETGINFMRNAEQFALHGLAALGEPRYLERINAESAIFGPLVQGLFIEQYHVTTRFVEIIAPLMTKRSSSSFKQRVYKYFQEELGHEAFERATCEALGVTSAELDAALPLPLFQAYVDAFTVFGRYDPIGYVSSIMVTEGMLTSVDNPVHHRLEELVSSKSDYQQVAKRHDDLNVELNHAALSRLFFSELSAISSDGQRCAFSTLAYLLELNTRALDQASDFYGPQTILKTCSLTTYSPSI